MTARNLKNTGGFPFLIRAVQFKVLSDMNFQSSIICTLEQKKKKKRPKAISLRDKARNRASNYLNTEAPRLKH